MFTPCQGTERYEMLSLFLASPCLVLILMYCQYKYVGTVNQEQSKFFPLYFINPYSN
jgi:hypothetical protein